MTDRENITRRMILRRGVELPIAGAVLMTAASCGQKTTATTAVKGCVNFDELTGGQKSLRESAQYVEVSADPSKICAVCAFYTGEEGTQCGHCQIFDGPASHSGYCISWSERTA